MKYLQYLHVSSHVHFEFWNEIISWPEVPLCSSYFHFLAHLTHDRFFLTSMRMECWHGYLSSQVRLLQFSRLLKRRGVSAFSRRCLQPLSTGPTFAQCNLLPLSSNMPRVLRMTASPYQQRMLRLLEVRSVLEPRPQINHIYLLNEKWCLIRCLLCLFTLWC